MLKKQGAFMPAASFYCFESIDLRFLARSAVWQRARYPSELHPDSSGI
jgi:hypothetical protein